MCKMYRADGWSVDGGAAVAAVATKTADVWKPKEECFTQEIYFGNKLNINLQIRT